MFDNEDHFVRLDLALGELGSGAAWVRQAAEQAAARMREGDRAADFMARMQQQQQKQQQGKAPSATVGWVRVLESKDSMAPAGTGAGGWTCVAGRWKRASRLGPGACNCAFAGCQQHRRLRLYMYGVVPCPVPTGHCTSAITLLPLPTGLC